MQKGVEIRVRADTSQAKKQIKSLEQSVAGLESTASKVAGAFKALAVTITGLQIGKKLSGASDTLLEMENRLALVVGRGKELSSTLERMYRVAERTRQPVKVVTDTFNRLGLALDGTGRSTKQLLIATEAIQQAAQISGASATTAEQAIIQLGQGLASGQLRGEELNSVLEGMPRLARAIAEGMGVPFGKLRELAKDGKLEAETIFEAILSQSEKLAFEFSTLEATTRSLAIVFGGEFTRALSILDKELGFGKNMREQLFIGIEALKVFNANFSIWVSLLKANITLALNDLTFFKLRMREILASIFTKEGINTEAFVDELFVNPFNSAKAKIEEVWSGINLPSLDLASKIPTFESISSNLISLKDGVIGVFKEIWDRITGQSLWTGIFDPAHMEPGQTLAVGSSLTKYFETPLRNLETFKNSIIAKFKEINKDATVAWEKIWTGLTTKTISTETGPEAVDTAFGRSIDLASDQLERAKNELKKVYEDILTDTIETPRGPRVVDSALVKTLKDIRDYSGQISETTLSGLAAAINALANAPAIKLGTILLSSAFTKTKESILSFGADIEEFKTSISNWFKENEAAISASISIALAAAIKFGAKKTLIVGAILGLFSFNADEVLNDEELQASLENLGAGYVQLLKSVFTTDPGSTLMEGLRDTLAAFGRGINKEIFGENFTTDTQDALAGAIGAITVAAVLTTGAREALKALGVAIAKVIMGTTIATELAAGLAIGLASMKMAPNSLLGTAAGNVGIALGQLIGKSAGAAATGLVVGVAVDIIVPDEAFNGLGGAIDNVIGGAAFGAQLGAAFGPYGVAGGAIAGGLAGAIYAAVTDPKVASGFKQIFRGLREALYTLLNTVGVVSDKTLIETRISDKAADITVLESQITQAQQEGSGAGPVEIAKLKNARFDLEKELFLLSESLKELNNAEYVALAAEAAEKQKAANDFIDRFITGSKELVEGIETQDEALLAIFEIQNDINSILRQVESGTRTLDAQQLAFLRSLKELTDGIETQTDKLANLGQITSKLNDGVYPTENFTARVTAQASGGYISGPGGPTEDLIPAMLSNGEYVIKASSVKKFGSGFLDKINSGIMPQFFSPGGLVSPYDESLKQLKRDLRGLEDLGATERVAATIAQISALESARANWFEQQDTDVELEDPSAGTVSDGKSKKSGKTAAESFYENFKSGFSSSLSQFLKDGDLKGFITGILDSFTSNIIDSFVDGFTKSLFGEGKLLKDLFSKTASFGESIAKTATSGSSQGVQGGMQGFLSFLLGSGGQGGLFSSIFGMSFGSWLGFSSGGIVPMTPYAQAGKDSVPAMLTPGEMVVPANQINKFMNGSTATQQQVYNINITGDISRQTRAEIVKMIPQITTGVNSYNYEQNYRR